VLNGERAAAGAPPLALGIALHHGQVMYGNIGAKDRLDFTVIGAAVNEACRVESLCAKLGVPVLLTAPFVAALVADGDPARVVSLGRHALKGVAASPEVFALEGAVG
jgi:adenylate cyclase